MTKPIDPVHKFVHGRDVPDEHYPTSGWYFYDETWSGVHGPFVSEAEARSECARYGEWLNSGTSKR